MVDDLLPLLQLRRCCRKGIVVPQPLAGSRSGAGQHDITYGVDDDFPGG